MKCQGKAWARLRREGISEPWQQTHSVNSADNDMTQQTAGILGFLYCLVPPAYQVVVTYERSPNASWCHTLHDGSAWRSVYIGVVLGCSNAFWNIVESLALQASVQHDPTKNQSGLERTRLPKMHWCNAWIACLSFCFKISLCDGVMTTWRHRLLEVS